MIESQKLIILCGIPFSGKSTLAKLLVNEKSFTRIDLDKVKFHLFGDDVRDEEIDQDGWDTIYQLMYQQICDALLDGKTVVHDTGNFTVYERGLVNQIAQQLNVQFVTVFVDTPVEEARRRLDGNRTSLLRFDISDRAFQDAVDEMEVPLNSENPLTLHAYDNLEEWVSKNL